MLEFKVADALAISGKATSVPSFVAPVVLAVAFFAMALGSNFPAYGVGDASPFGVAGDLGDGGADEACIGEPWAFLSIWSSRFRVPAAPSDSFCLRSRSAACFCFHASNLANRSAFFSSSVCKGGGGFFGNYREMRCSIRLVERMAN